MYPDLLFQRYMVAKDNLEETEAIFEYELSTSPAMFEESGLMWQSAKATVASVLWTRNLQRPRDANSDVEEVAIVLDGGSLLRHSPWTQNRMFALYILYQTELVFFLWCAVIHYGYKVTCHC